MKRTLLGSAIFKYLLAMLFFVLLIGFFVWKEDYGKIGKVPRLDFSTKDYIAFVRQLNSQTDICVIKADGTSLKRITNNKDIERSPAWSPDGKQIAYSAEDSTEGARTFQIFFLGAGEPRRATYGSIGKDSPQWSPDGKTIVFLSGGSIKVMNANGSDMEQVYPPPHKGGNQGEDESHAEDATKQPPVDKFRWAGNGMAVAAIQITEGENAPTLGDSNWFKKEGGGAQSQPENDTTVMEPETIIVLPRFNQPQIYPVVNAHKAGIAWFPDSIKLMVSLSSPKGQALAVFRTDERGLPPAQILVAAPGIVSPENPSVSPDGSKVAFEVWSMEGGENKEILGIAVMPTEGSPLNITAAADIARIPLILKGGVQGPRWSPDGTRLLYSQAGKSGRDIWVANADGSNPINLTKGEGDNYDAVWCPAK